MIGIAYNDLQFLRDHELNSRLINVTSSADITGTGVTVSYIPPTNRIFYLLKAKIVRTGGANFSASDTWTMLSSVRFDTTVIDQMGFSGAQAGVGETDGHSFSGNMIESTVIGKSMTGDGVKVVDINIDAWTGNNQVGRATLMGWIEVA